MSEIERKPKASRPNGSELHAKVLVEVRGSNLGAWQLPREQVTVGRARGAAVQLPFERVPRILATIVPFTAASSVLVHSEPAREGWLLVNGERTRARAENRRASVEAGPSGVIALQEGTTRVTWPELDETVILAIVVGALAINPALPVARDRATDHRAVPAPGTLMALQRSDVRPSVRHNMAVLFGHLLSGTPKPVNVYESAARELGTTEAALKRSATRLMGRINEHRFGDPIDTVDQLGHYLVVTAALITTDDLEGDAGR